MTFDTIYEQASDFLDSISGSATALVVFVVIIIVIAIFAERYRTRQMEALARELHCRFTRKREKTQDESYTERNVIEGTWRGVPILIYDLTIGRGDNTERQTVINGKHYAGQFLTYLPMKKIRRVLTGDRTIPEVQTTPPLPGATRVATAVTKASKAFLRMFVLWFVVSFIVGIVVYFVMTSVMFS